MTPQLTSLRQWTFIMLQVFRVRNWGTALPGASPGRLKPRCPQSSEDVTRLELFFQDGSFLRLSAGGLWCALDPSQKLLRVPVWEPVTGRISPEGDSGERAVCVLISEGPWFQPHWPHCWHQKWLNGAACDGREISLTSWKWRISKKLGAYYYYFWL